MSILQLADAKAHARITITDDDALIQDLIEAAESYLACFIGVALTDASLTPYPAPLLLATKQLVTFLYDNRESVVGNTLNQLDIVPGFSELVAPYRTYVF